MNESAYGRGAHIDSKALLSAGNVDASDFIHVGIIIVSVVWSASLRCEPYELQ